MTFDTLFDKSELALETAYRLLKAEGHTVLRSSAAPAVTIKHPHSPINVVEVEVNLTLPRCTLYMTRVAARGVEPRESVFYALLEYPACGVAPVVKKGFDWHRLEALKQNNSMFCDDGARFVGPELSELLFEVALETGLMPF